MIFDDFWWFGGCKKCVFHWQGRQNMQSGRKWVWAALESILLSFWLLLGCLGEPKMRQSRFQEGVGKSVDFRDLFFGFWLIWSARGGGSKIIFGCFFASFSVLGAIFFWSGAFLGRFYGFWWFGKHFWVILAEFYYIQISECSSILQPRLQQKSPRFAQDSDWSRQDSEQFSAHPRAPGV